MMPGKTHTRAYLRCRVSDPHVTNVASEDEEAAGRARDALRRARQRVPEGAVACNVSKMQ
jgi:hypothetical protein